MVTCSSDVEARKLDAKCSFKDWSYGSLSQQPDSQSAEQANTCIHQREDRDSKLLLIRLGTVDRDDLICAVQALAWKGSADRRGGWMRVSPACTGAKSLRG